MQPGASGAQQQPAATIDDLGDAVLELVFAAVCATPAGYRHCVALPLVCRRWNGVYTQVGQAGFFVAVLLGGC